LSDVRWTKYSNTIYLKTYNEAGNVKSVVKYGSLVEWRQRYVEAGKAEPGRRVILGERRFG
jgi:hypothetical protein